MAVNRETYWQLEKLCREKNVTLVAVSKTKPVEDIRELYDLGQRDFGENYVQELVEKQALLPSDIRWHFIGHLQSNKVKYIAPFVHLIHGVDSHKLLLEIDKQAGKLKRTIDCLLQVHIAREETKFGFSQQELTEVMDAVHKYHLMNQLQHTRICGLMGMASFTDDVEAVRKEFIYLKALYDQMANTRSEVEFDTLSMGMSADYHTAMEEGASMIRIGSMLFGARSKPDIP